MQRRQNLWLLDNTKHQPSLGLALELFHGLRFTQCHPHRFQLSPIWLSSLMWNLGMMGIASEVETSQVCDVVHLHLLVQLHGSAGIAAPAIFWSCGLLCCQAQLLHGHMTNYTYRFVL